MNYLIGLTGYAGSGKDTAAAALTGTAGYVKDAVAEGVKEMLLRLDPVLPATRPAKDGRNAPPFGAPSLSTLLRWGGPDLSTLEGVKRSYEFGPALRSWLQALGAETRRIAGADVFIRALEERWNDSGRRPLVVTDLRYPLEFDWVHRNGGKVLRILRPGTGPANDHVSEVGTAFAWTDGIVVNDGPEEHLRQQVLAWAAQQNLLPPNR